MNLEPATYYRWYDIECTSCIGRHSLQLQNGERLTDVPQALEFVCSKKKKRTSVACPAKCRSHPVGGDFVLLNAGLSQRQRTAEHD